MNQSDTRARTEYILGCILHSHIKQQTNDSLNYLLLNEIRILRLSFEVNLLYEQDKEMA